MLFDFNITFKIHMIFLLPVRVELIGLLSSKYTYVTYIYFLELYICINIYIYLIYYIYMYLIEFDKSFAK